MNSNIFTALTLDDDDSDEVILTPRNRRPDTDLLKFMKALENGKVSKVTPAPAPDIKSLDKFKITGISIELVSRRAAEKGSSLIRPLVWIDLEMTGTALRLFNGIEWRTDEATHNTYICIDV